MRSLDLSSIGPGYQITLPNTQTMNDDEWDLETITDGMEVLEIATATLLSETASGQPKQTEWSRPRPPSPFSATFIIIPHSKDTKHFMNKIHNTIYSEGELLSDYTDERGLYDDEENKYSRVAFRDYELCIYNSHHPSANALRDTRNALLQRPLKSCLKVKSNPSLGQDMVLLQEADDGTWDEWYGRVLRDNSYLIRNAIYQINDRQMEEPQYYVPEAKSTGVELDAVKYETAKL